MLEHDWVDFGQQERLTVRLKELIRNYPRGIGIIKEFIQNADDAGARSLSVLLDLRFHPAHRLRDPRMKGLMGPALLIANESVFSPRDFQSIQHIGESNKTESGPKTGRFGLGFNTCYNVTDYPSFVTGEDVVCFDPHQDAIARPGGQPGVRGTLKDIWETSPDWLATFVAAGLAGHAARHAGTIFRLPLRTPDQAAASEISKESFCKDAFDEIVSQLKTDGPELLLFTKHLLSIAVMEVDEATGEPKVLLRVSTANADAVASAREEVLAAIDGSPLPELFAKWRKDPDALPCVTYTHDFEVAENGHIRTQSWRVANGLFSDPQKKLLDAAQAMLTVGEKAVPWAGVAAKLVTANGTLAVERVDGHMYCGLPLTDETPLPVHINGYFDLDSSRRALSADRNVIGANRARVSWNEQLMQHGVAAAYAALLVDLRDAAEGDALAFYETFPDLKAMKSQLLSTLGRSVYAKVANRPTIRACASGKPDWLPIEKVWLARERLKPPLIAEGKPVAEPSLPFHVKVGFESVGQTLRALGTRKRAAICGGAGTGKTLLAVERAKSLATSGAKTSDIAVLVAAPGKAAYYAEIKDKPLPQGARWSIEAHRVPDSVLVDTVSRFKGLESAIVFLWGLQELRPDIDRESLYVGFSRAKSRLYLVGIEQICEDLLHYQIDSGKSMVTTDAQAKR